MAMKKVNAEIFEIALKIRTTQAFLPFDGGALTGFKIVKVPLGKWGADPFLFKKGEDYFLFAELFDLFIGKGGLYCRQLNAEHPKWRKCSVDKCHLSFPNVYAFNDELLMIPETSELNSISFYKCQCFPLIWKRNKTLVEGHKAVDNVLLSFDGITYLFSYHIDQNPASLLLYREIDGKFDVFQTFVDKEKTLRPAGKIFSYHDDFYLPTQDCKNGYGNGVIINQVCFDSGRVSLHPVSEINLEKLIKDSCLDEKILGIHTYNSVDKYEVIDLKKSKFSLLRILGKPFRVVFHTRKRK